jgi:hypothetical protein
MEVRKQPAPPQQPVFSGECGDNPIEQYATYMPGLVNDMMWKWIYGLPIIREKARKAAQAPRRKARERAAKALATFDAHLATGMPHGRARDATVVEHHISPRTLDRYLEKRGLRQQPR